MLPSPAAMFIGLAAMALPGIAAPAGQFYDLGGPCEKRFDLNLSRAINAAANSKDWDSLVQLQKQDIRDGCEIEYRWWTLADILLKAGRQVEAVGLLQEMDDRGFEINPAMIARQFPAMPAFMESSAFSSSPLGSKIGALRAISDARRATFQAALRQIPPNQRPPENYIAKAACPFECCHFGEWPVLEDTELVAGPGSRKVVGRAIKGSSVTGITGEVHLKPEPVAVLRGDDLPPNSIAFVLDYQGEGFGRVYSQGKIISLFLGYEDYCFHLSESCWGERLTPPGERQAPVWWITIRLPNGVIGWTTKSDNFSINACE
jgi:hypothetical protein